MATDKQIAEWTKQIQEDYPFLDKYFIDLTLQLYKSCPEYFKDIKKQMSKEEKKRKKSVVVKPQPVLEYYGNVEIESADKEKKIQVSFD